MDNIKEKQEVLETVNHLIERGSQYDVEALEQLYHPELELLLIDEHSNVKKLTRIENMQIFREKRNAGDTPISTAAEFNYVESDGQTARVIVTRCMALTGRPEKSVFSLILVHEQDRWQIIHETVFSQPVNSENATGHMLCT